MFRTARAVLALLTLAGAACTPYALATTARPLVEGERSLTQIYQIVPGGARYEGDSTSPGASATIPSIDLEHRIGLGDESDVGIRINSFGGVIVSHKRRVSGLTNEDSPATAIMTGAGFVNLGQHAHFEATVIRSGREDRTVVPYGGARLIQILPIATGAVSDHPTMGAFGGLRIGGRDRSVGVEIGVSHDRSALGLRPGHWVVVPSISVHGARLARGVPTARRLPGKNSPIP